MRLMSGLDAGQRRIVLAVCVVATFLLTLNAAFNYLLTPILETFSPSETQTTLLRQVPSIGALLVVFPAGALGARIGPRRFILGCALLFIIGSALIAVAPVIEMVTLGFLLVNVGRAAMFIVGLAFMAAAVGSRDGRASAFATFSMILPAAYLVMPILTGVLVDGLGWRWVAGFTAVGGLMATVLAARLLPRDGDRQPSGEMWTPAFAGVGLVLLVQAMNAVPTYGLLSVQTLGPLVGAVICVGVIAVLMRRLASPSVSVEALRHGGFLLLLSVILLFCFANLWFYTTLAFQYVYGMSTLQTAWLMLPAQVASIFGAAVAGTLIKSRGIPIAGSVLMLGVAVCLLASATVGVQTPVWVPVVIVAVYAALAVGAGVPMTNAIMDLASRSNEGGASSWRSAASNLGAAVSVAFMTAIVAASIGMSLDRQMEGTQAGSTMTSQELSDALRAINGGRSQQDVADQYAVPVGDIAQLSQDQAQALMVGYQTQGIVGGVVTLGVTVIFWVVTRREERERAVSEASA